MSERTKAIVRRERIRYVKSLFPTAADIDKLVALPAEQKKAVEEFFGQSVVEIKKLWEEGRKLPLNYSPIGGQPFFREKT